MVERRLPKPKVAGSNPVFRSKKTPPEPQTAAHRPRSFLFHLTQRSGKRGSPQDLLLPPVEGRGGYKKARNTRADFESLRTKNQCEFEPRFPLKGNSPRATDRSTLPAVFFIPPHAPERETGFSPRPSLRPGIASYLPSYTSFPTFTAAGRDILIFCVSSLRETQGAECNNRHCPPLAIDN